MTSPDQPPAPMESQAPLASADASNDDVPTEIIAARAYDKWVQHGRPSGTDLRDWLEAEAELTSCKDLALQLVETNAQLQKVVQALQDSEALYHSLVETLPVCMFRKDLNGRFTFGNQAFCDTLRRPLDYILGKTDIAFYPSELRTSISTTIGVSSRREKSLKPSRSIKSPREIAAMSAS